MNKLVPFDRQDSFNLFQYSEAPYNIFDDGTSQNISMNESSPDEMINIDCKVKLDNRTQQQNNTVVNRSKKIKKQIKTQNVQSSTIKIKQHIDPKNLPKQLGNNFRKFVEQYDQELSPALTEFLNKKEPKKQANYTLHDFKQLCKDNIGQQLFSYYLNNQAILDFINSRKVEDPNQHIYYLAIYASGAQSPNEWNSHHNKIKYSDQQNQ